MKVLFLDLDSMSAEHLGCYGYQRETSPNIDRIAEEGVRFTNYYTSDAPCFPSRTALMTGQFGIHNGVVGHGGTAGDVRPEGIDRGFQDRLASESFPALFRSAGLKTTLISPFAERHSAWTFYAGFNEIHNTGKKGMESAEEVTPTVLDWLDRNRQIDDWLLYVNYWDPHTPYRAPKGFGNPFTNAPLPEWMTEEVLEAHKKKIGPHSVHEVNMYNNDRLPEFPRYPGEIQTMEDMREMIDGYDCGVRHMDENIGMIFAALEEQGIMDEVIIVITADHGENLGELGIYGEHGTADQGTCRIPMIIRWPGVGAPKGHVDHGFHYHLDLPPTFAELFGLEPASFWDGQSFAPVLQKGEACSRDYLVISQCAHVCQRSVRFGEWLYMRTYHDGYHLFNREMLYNIKEDCFEQHDVAEHYPEICKDAVYFLNQWHDEMMLSMAYDIDPLWTVIKEGGPYHAKGNLKMYIEQLKATGREYAIPELTKRHPREFI
ncbi:sulfatase [Pullulanibacillus camelliae]|uniref:Sulfatase n=1 Tax=Pullulanibacillus camelliae TaxID=1707096 RepID=A0A8J2VJG3_9BACL|nr:sulfatase [Pullulanibacillus camelliae]GGE26651.1 sulfatase [Pullulanibacillus camelliae]